MRRHGFWLILAGFAAMPGLCFADEAALCGSIAHLVDATGGEDRSAPVFVRSYEPAPDEKALPPPLATSAFSYDNALAMIALIACGDVMRAKRIGDAFVQAIGSDRTFKDGRIRNAYRAGPLKSGIVAMPGWWDARHNLWAEDAYQDGTQTGNVAWVALALLALSEAAEESSYKPAAFTLAQWIASHANDHKGGFTGGMAGFDAAQTTIAWKSTEHNVDVHALGAWLSRLSLDSLGPLLAEQSRSFLQTMFDSTNGMFRLGTLPDGRIQPADKYALDALIWPLVAVANPPGEWRASFDFAKRHMEVSGGFDFNGDRDGFWTEGTAQAALVERAIGDRNSAREHINNIARFASPSGLLYATGSGQITTGLAVSDASEADDFYYFHRPHLGATAWAILAATGTNPFSGQKIN